MLRNYCLEELIANILRVETIFQNQILTGQSFKGIAELHAAE